MAEYGKLVPPYPVTHCAAEECRVELSEDVGVYLFTDLESGKFVCFCAATAAEVELHHAARFKLVML